jgi:hypothetical protein
MKMKRAVIEIDSSQLLNALEQLRGKDLKKVIDAIFLRGLFKKPDFEDVSKRAKRVIKRQQLNPNIVEEAVQWARKQK